MKPCGHQGEEDCRLWGEEQEQRLEFAQCSKNKEHSVAYHVFLFLFNVAGIFFNSLKFKTSNVHKELSLQPLKTGLLLAGKASSGFKEKQGRTKSRQVQLTPGQAREGHEVQVTKWSSQLISMIDN